jgi:hypothetical protein
MASLLESIDVPGSGSPLLNISATLAMGLIKGSIGPDFVIACVDFTIDVTYGGTSQRPAADCQRMIWSGDRRLIGPGPEPADAPSVWPGTDATFEGKHSGGCGGWWHPGVSGEGLMDGGHDVDAVFGGGADVAADGEAVAGDVLGLQAAGDLLLGLVGS